eukprot:15358768-Ditylum_brightwellii.AAC.2
MSFGGMNVGDEANLKRNFCVRVGVFCTICVNISVLLSTYFDRAVHLPLCVLYPCETSPPLLRCKYNRFTLPLG